ncbi:hypothetical protein F2Q68_00005226 [Brassica cretica]|uniref:Uncharacterized protein n=1 Tax=Brassica cretica TaxID=69181 RepID=A0A8S9JDK6_BRACR|nr:hypothetical protein F2Q68_00005226 [Brassica cretica]
MEEDTNAILSKMNAPKAPAAKNANTRQEPRQHAPTDKNGRKDGYMYVVNENNVPVSTLVVRGEGWNKWVMDCVWPSHGQAVYSHGLFSWVMSSLVWPFVSWPLRPRNGPLWPSND